MGTGRGCGGWASIEPSFQRAFRAYGRFLLKNRVAIALPVAAIFIAVGFGSIVLERESDPLTVWLSSRGRIHDEKAFFEDRFEDKSPDNNAFIIEPREPGANLLAPERVVAVLDEVRDLQEWIRTFEYKHRDGRSVTLESICFKPVDLKDTEPCFQYSILDCFAEGAVFAPGGEMNTEFNDLYGARPSYTAFDFAEDFTEDYVRQRCVQWFNLGTADTMFLGSPNRTSNSRGEPTVTGVEALRVVFGTKPKERLAADGLVEIAFTPDEGGDSCLVSSDCPRCVEELGLSSAAQAGCVPAAVAQSDSCCEFMTALRAAPCVEELFVAKPQVENLGNLVFQACGIPALELNKRCANQLAIAGTPQLCSCVDGPDSIACDAAIRGFVEESEGADGGARRRLREAAGGVHSRALLQQEASRESDGNDGTLAGNGTQGGNGTAADAPPAVCVCLADRNSTECAEAGLAFAGTMPETAPAFLAASQGDEDAMAEVTQILISDAGCPAVCVCLGDSLSNDCTDAGAAFAVANPDTEATFVEAAFGNQTALDEVAAILIDRVGCPAPASFLQSAGNGTAGNATAIDGTDGNGNATAGAAEVNSTTAEGAAGNATAGDSISGNATDGVVADICVCLADGESAECATAGAAFIGANPDVAPVFVAAGQGDEEARAEVTQILLNDTGCPAVCMCLGDILSLECTDAGAAFTAANPQLEQAFVDATFGNETAKEEFREILINNVGCLAPADDAQPEVDPAVGNATVGNATAGNATSMVEAAVNASVGNATAVDTPSGNATVINATDSMAADVDATAGNGTVGNATAVEATSSNTTAGNGTDGNVAEVCVCLANRESPECSAAGLAFAQENPDTLPTFAAASGGDEVAIAEVAQILIRDAGCPPVCICLGNSSSPECSAAGAAFAESSPGILATFGAAANGSQTAADEIREILTNDVGCPVAAVAAQTDATPSTGNATAGDATGDVVMAGNATADNATAVVPTAVNATADNVTAGSVADVCVCLANRESPECSAAGLAYAQENPDTLPTFAAAAGGDEAAITEVVQILIRDAGCPAVCICLGNSSSPECSAAVAAFAESSPDVLATFGAAANGSQTAADEVQEILTDEVGCPLAAVAAQTDAAPSAGNATAGNATGDVVMAGNATADNATAVEPMAVNATAGNGTDGNVADVCVCLSDRESAECSTAGIAYITANPDARDTFSAASGGDEAARAQVAQILVRDAGCPAVCTCLGNSSSPQCSSGANDFLATNSDVLPIFATAQTGDPDAVAQVRDILINDVGCPVPTSTSVPDVCVCLADSNSPECAEAGAAYAAANPDAAPTFVAASEGNETASAQVGQILLNDAGCPAVCTCLANSSSPSCTAASAAEFSGSDMLATFTAAAGGNASALAAAQDILINDIGCPAPLSVTSETIGVCSADPDSAECNTAVLSLFMAATNDSTAKAEVAQLVSRSLLSGIDCPVPETAAPSEDSDAPAQGAENTSVQTTAEAEGRQRFLATPERIPLKDEDEAWSIVDGWEHAWRDVIGEKVKEYSTIKVSWFSSTSAEDILEDAASRQAPLVLAGYVLVIIYIVVYFGVSFRTGRFTLSVLPPGPLSALLCVLAIFVAVFATFGIIGLVSLTDFKTSPITLQVVPLLMVGLGINDFFVLATTMRVILERSPTSTLGEVMAETMAKGGTSITLSSLTNALAFGLGALSPVPAVEWFSIHMMVGVIVSYIFSVTITPVILSWAASRHLAGVPDLLLCCKDVERRASTAFKARTLAGDFDSVDVKDRAAGQSRSTAAKKAPKAPTLPHKVFDSVLYKLLVLAVFIGWLGFSVWGVTRLDRGLKLSTTVPGGSNEYNFLKASEDHFSTYPVYVVFREEDFSVHSVFNDSRKAEFDFVDQAHNADRGYKVTSVMEYYTQYTESKVCSNTVCLDEVDWYWDGFSSEEFASEADKLKNVCLELPAGQTCEARCRDYCPQGPLGSPFRCQLSADGQACYCPWRPKLRQDLFYENPEGFTGSIKSFWTDFLNNTSGGGVSRNLIDLDGETTERNLFGKPIGARSLAFVEDVPEIPDRIKHLRSGRKSVDSAPVEAFPFDFIVYGIGEQYENIRENTAVAIAISIGVAALAMMPLIVHWFAGVLVSLCVASAVAIGTGMVHWIGLSLNYTAYVSLVVSVGLSVEFCAHIARDFMLTQGGRSHRAYKALKHMGLAVFNGGFTTFLSLLPLAWSEYPYFKNYFFGQYSMVTAVGLFVGLFLLPVLLAMFGPDAFQDKEQCQRLAVGADDLPKRPTGVGVDDSARKPGEAGTAQV